MTNEDDQDRESKDNAEGRREPSKERMTSRSRKVKPAGKKRRLPKGGRAHARKQGTRSQQPRTRSTERGSEPELPPIIPQPSIESFEEGASDVNRPEQEPPPPTASAQTSGLPGGDADDLFEYVF